MKFIDQTLFGEEGNCVQASVASILGLELDEVPNFIKEYPETPDFWDAVEDFFLEKGFVLWLKGANLCLPVNYLAQGKTSRGYHHMVVMNDGKLVHDPHPDRKGIIEVEHTWLVIPVDAAICYASKTERNDHGRVETAK